MRHIEEQKVFDKYPEIFREVNLSMQETCMCWGLEVPYSWIPIIDSLCGMLESKRKHYICNFNYNGESKTYKFPLVVAKQVKEKYGTLRFYYELDFGDQDVIDVAYKKFEDIVDGAISLASYQCSKLQ
jgi:hypothetical protein